MQRVSSVFDLEALRISERRPAQVSRAMAENHGLKYCNVTHLWLPVEKERESGESTKEKRRGGQQSPKRASERIC